MSEQACLKFVVRIKERNRINLIPFNAEKWFSGALSTLNLRFRGPRLTPHQKDALRECLMEFCTTALNRPFDQALDQLFIQLRSGSDLSLGHAQKLASIFLKYGYVTHVLGIPSPIDTFVGDHKQQLPVPIDKIVLQRLAPRPPYVLANDYAANLRQIDGSIVPWTKLTCSATYWNLQKLLRSLAAKEGCIPLEYEMSHLWVA